MSSTFAVVVEDVQRLSTAEKLELRDLLDQYLVDERREAIFASGEESRERLAAGELIFTADVGDLMQSLDG